MRCRFSHLRTTLQPTRASSVREVATGVRWATPATRWRASASRSGSSPRAGAAAGRAPPAPARPGLGLAAGIERALDLLGSELGHLPRQLTHRTSLLERALGDLGGPIVADERVERGGHTGRDLDVAAAGLRTCPQTV